MSKTRPRSLRIDAGEHPVFLGDGALAALDADMPELSRGSAVFVLGDENTLEDCLPELIARVPALAEAGTIEVPSGERSKDVDMCRRIWEHLAEHAADRQALLVCLGGGVITDLGGFSAAVYKRGISFLHVPTTLMGMVDAAIGSKTAIDVAGVKNLVGLFAPPKAVYVHPPFLRTLGKRQLLNGVAEMVKHGLVRDAAHWNAVRRAPLHDLDALTPLIERSATIKAEVVCEDPKEAGIRQLLNFGHTIGHALEAHALESTQRTLLHGEAVAVGMVCEAWLSWRLGLLDREKMNAVQDHLLSLFPHFPLQPDQHHRVISLMRNDKKSARGEFLFTLLTDIGAANTGVPVTASQVADALDHYRLLAPDAAPHHHS